MSILFKGNIEEGNYTLIKSTDGWVLKGETSYAGFNFADRPQGEWEYVAQGWHSLRRCSNCKWTQTCSDSKYMGYRYNFCPHCGADMRERKESE